MDFDHLNLDYMLLTSELYFYNDPLYPYHEYRTEWNLNEGLYNEYSHNTLGALQDKIKFKTTEEMKRLGPSYAEVEPLILDTIKPVWVEIMISDGSKNDCCR